MAVYHWRCAFLCYFLLHNQKKVKEHASRQKVDKDFLPQLHPLIIIKNLRAQHIIIFRLDEIDIS